MNVYQKYKDAQGRKTGPWFIKYPISRDPLTGKIKYKIEKVGFQKKLAERAYQKKMWSGRRRSIWTSRWWRSTSTSG
ncbi:MAG: hypothetical protein M1438_08885 [Deltaproteobacteria bacterium]|nr:hypothetical protein [Deltaproteobacteria bacterium]